MTTLTCAICGLDSQDTNRIETDCIIINPENEQRLLYGQTVCTDCLAADEREQFITLTTEHHDWTSPTQRAYDALVDLWNERMFEDFYFKPVFNSYINEAKNNHVDEADARVRFQELVTEIGQYV